MYIPQQVVQVLHEERIQELLKDAKIRRGYIPQDKGIHITTPAKNKWRLGLATIPALLSHLKLNWKWRFAFPQTDNQLACETLCED